MRRWSAFILSLVIAVSALAQKETPPTQMFTVAEFKEALAAAHGLPDKKLAEHIADVKLTERMSDQTFAKISADLPGPISRLALLGLADESQFLDPPAAELPTAPPPDQATQQALIKKALDYVAKAIPQLPDFIATRNVQVFDGTPQLVSPDLHHALYPSLEDDWRLVNSRSGHINVRYSNGIDVFNNPTKKKETTCDPLTKDGMSDFGELLPRVAENIIKGKVVWSHWEQGPKGILPAFHYEATLLWNLPHRCKNDIYVPQPSLFEFQGDVTINPTDGSFSRVTERLHSEQPPWGPRGLILYTMIEYGPVDIGGSAYICPLRNVDVGFAPAFWGGSASEIKAFNSAFGLSQFPTTERVDDITYTDYHIFRAKSRILPGTAPDPPAPNPGKASPPAPLSRPTAPGS